MEFSIRILAFAVLAFIALIILVMMLSGMIGGAGEAYSSTTDWISGIIGTGT